MSPPPFKAREEITTEACGCVKHRITVEGFELVVITFLACGPDCPTPAMTVSEEVWFAEMERRL